MALIDYLSRKGRRAPRKTPALYPKQALPALLAPMFSLYPLAACFLFYVIFVQYALLNRWKADLGFDMQALMPGLAAMAALGALGAIISGLAIDRLKFQLKTVAGSIALLASALAATGAFALGVDGLHKAWIALAGLGLLLGLLIVPLLTLVTRHMTGPLLGMGAGLAAAVIYAAACVIAGYFSDPKTVGMLGVGLAVSAAAFIALFAKQLIQEPLLKDESEPVRVQPVLCIAALFALVAGDTSAFHAAMNLGGESTRLFPNGAAWLESGFVHFFGALIAGLMFRRRGVKNMMLASAVLLLAASGFLFALLSEPRFHLEALLCQAAMVAVYTTVLFACWPHIASPQNRSTAIGIGMAFCGFAASALGIGAADFAGRLGDQRLIYAPAAAFGLIAFFLASMIRPTMPAPQPKGGKKSKGGKNKRGVKSAAILLLFVLASCACANKVPVQLPAQPPAPAPAPAPPKAPLLDAAVPVYPGATVLSKRSDFDGPPEGEKDQVVAIVEFTTPAAPLQVEKFYRDKAPDAVWLDAGPLIKASFAPPGFAENERVEIVIGPQNEDGSGGTLFTITQQLNPDRPQDQP